MRISSMVLPTRLLPRRPPCNVNAACNLAHLDLSLDAPNAVSLVTQVIWLLVDDPLRRVTENLLSLACNGVAIDQSAASTWLCDVCENHKSLEFSLVRFIYI